MIDSKQQDLTPDEIVQEAARETGSSYSPEQIKASIMAEIHEQGAVSFKQGNTLFIVHRSEKDPSIGLFRALNADTAENYLQNSLVFIKAMKEGGLRTLVTQFEDPSILNIFRYISRNPPFPGMGYSTGKTKDGKYQVTINLGNEARGGLEAV